MKEQLLNKVKKAQSEIKSQRAVIDNAIEQMLSICPFKAGDKVRVFALGHGKTGGRTGQFQDAFICNVSCGDSLEYNYNYLAVKKDGTPSKQSAGIWWWMFELELI